LLDGIPETPIQNMQLLLTCIKVISDSPGGSIDQQFSLYQITFLLVIFVVMDG